MFRYTAEIVPYHDYDLDSSLREVASLGFKEVNLWTSSAPLARHVNPGDDIGVIKALLKKYDLKACGLTMYGKTQDEMLQRIEFAADLDIDTVIFDCEANYPDFISKFLPPLVELGAKKGVRIAVENHLTVPFSEDFEHVANEEKRWDEGVDSLAQIKRLVQDIDHPNLGVCLAPPHLWVMGDSVSEAITYLQERKRLYYYYIWDIDRAYKHGIDGLNFGPGEEQLPRINGTLDHFVPLKTLKNVGYTGAASIKCHGTHGWSIEKITNELRESDKYVRSCLERL